MPPPKNHDLVKKTLNLRRGDFEAMASLFPSLEPSQAIRQLISAFVDRHQSAPKPIPLSLQELSDE